MGIESVMRAAYKEKMSKKTKSKSKKTKTKSSSNKKESNDKTRKWLKSIIINYMHSDTTNFTYKTEDFVKLLDMITTVVKNEPSLLEIESPTFVCGDIHGQLTDLKRVFHICGFPSVKRYLFLGDYVDRGHHSIEVLCIIIAMKLLFPKNVFMLRGNHELSHINREYGFYDDIEMKCAEGDTMMLYDKFNEFFSYLPLAAVISKKILCMHGGPSPSLQSLDDLRSIKRPIINVKGMTQDLLWSDPQVGCTGWKPNRVRGCSFNFGEKEAKELLKKLGVSKMIRAHQVVQRGWDAFAGGAVITVFTASRYEDDIYNYGAVINIKKNLGMGVIMIKPADFENQKSIVNDPPTEDFPPESKKEDNKEQTKVKLSLTRAMKNATASKKREHGADKVEKDKKASIARKRKSGKTPVGTAREHRGKDAEKKNGSKSTPRKGEAVAKAHKKRSEKSKRRVGVGKTRNSGTTD